MKPKFDIEIDFMQSQGSYVYDIKTQAKYLDMFNMWSSLPLGYRHHGIESAAITGTYGFLDNMEYLSLLKMCNNVFESAEYNNFLKKFKKTLPLYSDFHFCCTGSLAVESAVKCALTYKRGNVVGLRGSFHGVNSWGLVTDCPERLGEYPRFYGFVNTSVKDIVRILSHHSICTSAVVIEPIQCTAGDIYPNIDDLLKIQLLCKKNDVCLIVDEIQTGFGTTGTWWYHEQIGLIPDIVVFGKKAQVSGIATTDKYADAINSEDMKLSVTFDGDLIDMVRSTYIMEAYEQYNLIKQAHRNQKRFADKLMGYFESYRGVGNLLAFDLPTKQERDAFVRRVYDKKLLVSPANETTVRLRPNMAVTLDEIDECINRLIE